MKHFILLLTFLISINIGYSQINRDSVAYNVGSTIESQFYKGKTSYLDSIFDRDYFFDQILIKEDNPELKEFNLGFKSANLIGEFSEPILTSIDAGAYVNFVNYYPESADIYNVIFRMYSAEGINYIEFQIKIDELGEPKLIDIFPKDCWQFGAHFQPVFSNFIRRAQRSV